MEYKCSGRENNHVLSVRNVPSYGKYYIELLQEWRDSGQQNKISDSWEIVAFSMCNELRCISAISQKEQWA